MALLRPAVAHQDSERELIEAGHSDSRTLTLDKSEQRRIGVRTLPVSVPPPAIELPAKVVADPRQKLTLTADQPGIVEAPPGGFVNAGDTVQAGQILAILRPVLSTPEQRDLETDLAFAHRDVELGKTQIKRYGIDMAQQFDVKLPTPSIQVILDYRTAEKKVQQYSSAMNDGIPLRAPAAGLVLRNALRRGAAVASGDILFDLAPRNSVAIEMDLADRGLDAAAALQAKANKGPQVSLHFLSAAYDSTLRVQRVFYAVKAPEYHLEIGEPVWVKVPQSPANTGTWEVPAAAVIEDHGTSWLWVHEAAEQFVAHAVSVEPASSGWVQVQGMLDDDDRVVVEGAAALQQRSHQSPLHL
jgi:biotin carboxyl carrier protein